MLGILNPTRFVIEPNKINIKIMKICYGELAMEQDDRWMREGNETPSNKEG